MRKMRIGAAVLATGLFLAGSAAAQEVVRYKLPNSDFPVVQAVEIPAGAATVYLSGAVPTLINDAVDRNTAQAYGDTKTQTESVFKAIAQTLGTLGLKMGDVVKMQVFLVGDPAKGSRMDVGGFMEGYRQFFGTEEQPNLPARSVVQVAGLVNPGFLVEIEVTAVRP